MMADRDVFKKVLEEGESIKLCCPSQSYELFDEEHKKQTTAAWTWALALGIILVGGYIWLCYSRNIELKAIIIVICAAIPLAMAWSPAADKKNIKKLRYAITDRRAITASTDGDKAHSMAISDIDAARLERAGIGTCHLRLGSPTLNMPLKKLPSMALNGKYETLNTTKIYTGLVFYNISTSEGEEIYNILKSEVKTIESI
jgi:hypothetical protein